MKACVWCVTACSVLLGISSVALAVLKDDELKCTVPSENNEGFCKDLGRSEEGECMPKHCSGTDTGAIERNKFPKTRDKAKQGVTTDSLENCWRTLACKEESKTKECVPDPDNTNEWYKADKIVANPDRKCPAVHETTAAFEEVAH